VRCAISVWLACSIAYAQYPEVPNEIAQPGEAAHDDDRDVSTADPDPTPAPLEPLAHDPGETRPDVIEQAGVGGPVSYAAAGVLEVGGGGSILGRDGGMLARVTPYAGWFVFDGIELTLSNEIDIGYSGLDRMWRVAFVLALEPSVHVPLDRRLWIAFGVGGGLLYNGVEAGAIVVPRIGLDILIGRSGMLHLSAIFRYASTPIFDLVGRVQVGQPWDVGLDISYSALF
jgi:hypothetical protein